jgi:hypothetical protein
VSAGVSVRVVATETRVGMFVGEVIGVEVLHFAVAIACHFDIGKEERKESRRNFKRTFNRNSNVKAVLETDYAE